MAIDSPQYDTVIVVLGGSNDDDGRLHPMSLDRCREALETHQAHPNVKILTTGGWGSHFNTAASAHGELVKADLIQRGIPENQFYPTALSAHTEDDAVKACEVLRTETVSRILLVTSDFHMDRACHYFQKVFPSIEIIPRPAKSSLSEAELSQRQAHEETRMARIRQKG